MSAHLAESLEVQRARKLRINLNCKQLEAGDFLSCGSLSCGGVPCKCLGTQLSVCFLSGENFLCFNSVSLGNSSFVDLLGVQIHLCLGG